MLLKTQREKDNWWYTLNLKNIKKTKISERYDLISKPSLDTN
jgi:hypothetical protein